MKSFIISISIIATLLILLTINSICIINTTEKLALTIEGLTLEDFDRMNELNNMWEKKKFFISMSSSDKEIDRIDELISILDGKIQNGIQTDFEETKIYLIKYIEIIQEHEKITLNNLL